MCVIMSTPATQSCSDNPDKESEIFLVQFDDAHFGGQRTTDRYSEWADVYEQNLLNMSDGYKHPQNIAEIAATLLTDKNCRILDVCAGTGLGGAALKERGFVNIDALDGSDKMLAKAEEKGIYKNIYLEIIGTESLRTVQGDSYDAIVTSGSFVPGHLGPQQLRVLAQLLKTGGIFCMAMRAAYLETDYLRDMEPEFERMREEGLWSSVKYDRMDNYHNGLPGRVFICRKG